MLGVIEPIPIKHDTEVVFAEARDVQNLDGTIPAWDVLTRRQHWLRRDLAEARESAQDLRQRSAVRARIDQLLTFIDHRRVRLGDLTRTMHVIGVEEVSSLVLNQVPHPLISKRVFTKRLSNDSDLENEAGPVCHHDTGPSRDGLRSRIDFLGFADVLAECFRGAGVEAAGC
jgi:hypothetical protein